MTTMKQLLARQEGTQRDFEAARDSAEAIANQENEALGSDESYASWLRRKKLAELDLARLESELASVADEIQAEEGRQQRDALLNTVDLALAVGGGMGDLAEPLTASR